MKIRSFFLIALLIALTAGCAGMNTKSSAPEDATTEQSAAYEETYENPNYYYDFDDVLIPRELTPVDDEKYVFTDSRFHAGFRIFDGRVVAEDLFNFFVNNMAKDNWLLKYSLKSTRSLMIFEKANKSCTITIEDGFKTKVTVFAIELKGTSTTGGMADPVVRSSDVPE